MEKKQKICSICFGDIDIQYHPITGEMYWDVGHNAEPVNSGICCSRCNQEVVIIARLNNIKRMRK